MKIHPGSSSSTGKLQLKYASRLIVAVSAIVLAACGKGVYEPEPIVGAESTGPALVGGAAPARPIHATPVPAHPFMAMPGRSAMHNDAFSSDVYAGSGPTGRNPRIVSRVGRSGPGGMCATVTFDREGRLIALCANALGFQIQLLTPRSLKLLASFDLPARPSTFHALVTMDPSKVMSDTSGGAYYYLDNEDRVVLADSRQRIIRLGHRQTEADEWEFYLSDSWDLSSYVPQDCFGPTNWFPKEGECDPITAVMPDYNGLIWWVTRKARIGTLNPDTGEVQVLHLPGEEIQNGFSVDSEAVYIVTDFAMYAMSANPQGTPEVVWREAYDRGSARKVGSINQGSGTTPTLMGERYVTITDNADERINLLVYRRELDFQGQRLVCKVPLFTAGASATDNSMIAFDRSIIVENNNGYRFAKEPPTESAVTGGITRVDVREDESGCETVWESTERVPSVVAKLALATGLAYYYTFETQANGENAWYVMALDFATGETAFKIRTGAGRNFDNNWAPINLGPDGTLYVGSFKGITALWDGES